VQQRSAPAHAYRPQFMTAPRPLTVEIREDEERVLVVVVGELDLATAPEFEAALDVERARGRDLVLDLTGLEFIDSTGQRAIVDAVSTTAEAGRRLTIRGGLTDSVQRAFTLTGLLDRLPLE
jgi:anti-anti-sigma factor